MNTPLTTALTTISILCAASQVLATTYTFNDTWIDWPGFVSEHATTDALGTPTVTNIQGLKVTLSDDNLFLQKVDILLGQTQYLNFNSLFINTGYTVNSPTDAWDYLIHKGGGGQNNVSYTGTIVTQDGLYGVSSPYRYTWANDNQSWDVREGNPNGIDARDLTLTNIAYTASLNGNTLTYLFGGQGLGLKGGFFVAWTPWCANDVIGGGMPMDPVPEPATMLLFGTGMTGLAGALRRRMTR
jgi:hypothetical protein